MPYPTHLINQPCVITTRTQTGPDDEYGAPTWVESDESDLIHVQPVPTPASGEVVERPAGRLTHRGFLRPTSTISHGSKVTLESGQSWEVDGPPRVWFNPRSQTTMYQEVDLVGYES